MGWGFIKEAYIRQFLTKLSTLHKKVAGYYCFTFLIFFCFAPFLTFHFQISFINVDNQILLLVYGQVYG